MKIPLNSITILPDRQRTNIDPDYINKLADSLRLVGLIHPIVVDEKGLLVGECRVRAAKLLGWKEIEARSFSELDDLERELIELEENLRRKKLDFPDEVAAKARIHKLLQKKRGHTAQHGGKKGGWRLRDTASHLGISVGKMSQDVQLAKAIKRDPSLTKQPTKTAALAKMNRQESIKFHILLSKITKDKEPKKDQLGAPDTSNITLHHADCRDIIPTLPDASINCLITDPPWGVAHDSTSTGHTSYDRPRSNVKAEKDFELMYETLDLLLPKIAIGSLCWLFCASKHVTTGRICEMITKTGYEFHQYPIIWYKPKKAASSRPFDDIKQDFEFIVLFSRGVKRRFINPMWGVYIDTLEREPLHKNEKPLSLIKTLIETSTYLEEDVICDPFMGSGKTMLAAREMGRTGVGIEIDKQWYESSKALVGV